MGYWREVISCTIQAIGGTAGLVTAIVLPIAGGVLHYEIDGREAMEAELYVWSLYVLAPLGAAFVILLIWNMITAPLRIERRTAAAQRGVIEKQYQEEIRKLQGQLYALGAKDLKPVIGDNQNGSYRRYPDGTQTCTGVLRASTTDRILGCGFAIFPAEFCDPPQVTIVPDGRINIISVSKISISFEDIVIFPSEEEQRKAIKYTASGRYRRD